MHANQIRRDTIWLSEWCRGISPHGTAWKKQEILIFDLFFQLKVNDQTKQEPENLFINQAFTCYLDKVKKIT